MDLKDSVNSRKLIEKISDLEVVEHSSKGFESKVADEVKLFYATYFARIFIKFDIKAKHLDFIQETRSKSIKDAKIFT